MSDVKIENELSKLARDWPGDSVAEKVATQIEQEPNEVTASRLRLWPGMQAIAGLATAAIVLISVGFYLVTPRTFSAALQQNLLQQKSWHIDVKGFEDGKEHHGDIWFHRDHGFRMELMEKITLDDGEKSYEWRPTDASPMIYVRPSTDAGQMVSRLFDLSNMPDDWKKNRREELDQEVEGVGCDAYVLEPGVAGANSFRCIALIDNNEQPLRIIRQTKSDDETWRSLSEMTIHYGAKVDETIFARNFPADAKVVDISGVLDERYSLADAKAKTEKDGLIFAIHDCVPIDERAYYVVSSVRGTEKYLEQYPPTPRRLNSNYTALDVVHQSRSHGNVGRNHQVMMLSREWAGVSYMWRIVVLSDFNEPRNGADEGFVRVPLSASHMHKNQRDKRGVQRSTRLSMNVAIPDKTETLKQVVSRFRDDLPLISSVYGEAKSLPVGASVENGSMDFVSLDDISDDLYVEKLKKARWQVIHGDYSGNDPPDGFYDSLVAFPKLVPHVDPLAKFAGKPQSLPESIRGKVINVDGDPVEGAKVRVWIRRFNTKSTASTGEDLELDDLGPWTSTSNDQGEYVVSVTGEVRPHKDEVWVRVSAPGFTTETENDYELSLLQGQLPIVTVQKASVISGQIVDPKGTPYAKAIVRFQSPMGVGFGHWDSGPVAVDEDGKFSIAAPVDRQVAGAVYPDDFAPQLIRMGDQRELGQIQLDRGRTLRGRVVDKSGQGVGKTVVGIRSVDYILLDTFGVSIAMAVRTDESGNFVTPPILGEYKLEVKDAAPVYAKRMMITGKKPPWIEPVEIDTAEIKDELIVLKED